MGASRSNVAWPDTSRSLTVSLMTARLHRAPVGVAVPVHSPSYGPAAPALLNCGRSSKKAAAKTRSRPFITDPPLLYIILWWHHAMPATKEEPLPDLKSDDRPT